jgi:hypothetical protein
MRPAEETAHRARALHGAGVLDSIQGDSTAPWSG